MPMACSKHPDVTQRIFGPKNPERYNFVDHCPLKDTALSSPVFDLIIKIQETKNGKLIDLPQSGKYGMNLSTIAGNINHHRNFVQLMSNY